MPEPMRSIRVRVLDREYPLRVAPADEGYTVHLAQIVDERLRRIRRGLPAQPDLTHAVLGALELAEELFAARAEIDRLRARVEVEAQALVDRLDAALDYAGATEAASGDGHAGALPAGGSIARDAEASDTDDEGLDRPETSASRPAKASGPSAEPSGSSARASEPSAEAGDPSPEASGGPAADAEPSTGGPQPSATKPEASAPPRRARPSGSEPSPKGPARPGPRGGQRKGGA